MATKLRDTLAALLFLGTLAVGLLYLGLGVQEAQQMEGSGTLSSQRTWTHTRSNRKNPPQQPGRGVPLTFEEFFAGTKAATAEVENRLTKSLDRDHLFIEAYGLLQALQGRRVMEDMDPQYTVVRLSDGSLSFANPDAPYLDPTERAQGVVEFRDALEQKLGIPLLYVQAPQKVYYDGDGQLPAGLVDYGDAYANIMAHTLQNADVPYLDLRPVLAETGRYGELFFSTDHHWTPEGAFLGWEAVGKTLKTDFDLDIDPRSYTQSYYTQTTYEDVFLGSQGKRVGSLYAGTDDLTVWYPDSFTQLNYEVYSQDINRTGTFQQSVLFPERLEEEDLYQSNPYTYYSGGDYSFARMRNLLNPKGPKVVLLRDSFGCTFAPFMALGCGEVITIDLRYFHDDLMEYIQWVEADMVVMLYSPGSLKLPAMFDFFYNPDQTWRPDRKPPIHLDGSFKPAPGQATSMG